MVFNVVTVFIYWHNSWEKHSYIVTRPLDIMYIYKFCILTQMRLEHDFQQLLRRYKYVLRPVGLKTRLGKKTENGAGRETSNCSPVYTVRTNPGLTRVKTNSG